MEKYIEGNKAAWEEAFDNRDRICSACKGLGRKRWNNLSSGIHDRITMKYITPHLFLISFLFVLT